MDTDKELFFLSASIGVHRRPEIMLSEFFSSLYSLGSVPLRRKLIIRQESLICSEPLKGVRRLTY
jgi:hypothetical protein